ncbi:RnfABCDGE type electron transport complex subunit G [Pseudodesulfovibrio portus]|jgi:electron transport complex protein RnfG|uniref:Ion-translocating oxidoreductase complex subunit G n=1 Tax=Pseudodesulfovibrio portus TaxID=231439 RepID=A0ABN6RPW5_9BACT|nr:RnfABCDGE type electron transport complex subunit G [Pseudodesulfovibrio portus]BDQ32895.1 electron transport complex subunit G [Pseudodesulfovibrio portus]
MKEMIKMIVVLSLICALSGLTLATVRQATSTRIEEQVMTYVQGPALDQIFSDHDNNPVKDRKIFDTPNGPITVFPAMKAGKLTGVAFETYGKGYGGDIGVMVGFVIDGSKLEGIGITTLKETPGLGARVVEPEYRDQFKGHSTASIALEKQGGDIAAISGATISSTGTVAAVNDAVKIFNTIKDKLPTAWGS